MDRGEESGQGEGRGEEGIGVVFCKAEKRGEALEVEEGRRVSGRGGEKEDRVGAQRAERVGPKAMEEGVCDLAESRTPEREGDARRGVEESDTEGTREDQAGFSPRDRGVKASQAEGEAQVRAERKVFALEGREGESEEGREGRGGCEKRKDGIERIAGVGGVGEGQEGGKREVFAFRKRRAEQGEVVEGKSEVFGSPAREEADQQREDRGRVVFGQGKEAVQEFGVLIEERREVDLGRRGRSVAGRRGEEERKEVTLWERRRRMAEGFVAEGGVKESMEPAGPVVLGRKAEAGKSGGLDIRVRIVESGHEKRPSQGALGTRSDPVGRRANGRLRALHEAREGGQEGDPGFEGLQSQGLKFSEERRRERRRERRAWFGVQESPERERSHQGVPSRERNERRREEQKKCDPP